MQAAAPLERTMKRFVIRQNIEHYRAMLIVTTDPAQRVQIEGLLHEEVAKLKKYDDEQEDAGLQQDGLINRALIAPAAWRCWRRCVVTAEQTVKNKQSKPPRERGAKNDSPVFWNLLVGNSGAGVERQSHTERLLARRTLRSFQYLSDARRVLFLFS